MAKGRKLTAGRSERLLGIYGHNPDQGTMITANSELGEDEVWSMIDGDSFNADDSGEWSSRAAVDTHTRRRAPPRSDHRRQAGGLSLAFHDSTATVAAAGRVVHQFRGQEAESPHGRHVAASAPVNVPDWSKIYRVESMRGESGYGFDYGSSPTEVVPPHEYLAREYGKSAAHSVFEGVGRTLKGRDLSRVRDAVWSQTGFYG